MPDGTPEKKHSNESVSSQLFEEESIHLRVASHIVPEESPPVASAHPAGELDSPGRADSSGRTDSPGDTNDSGNSNDSGDARQAKLEQIEAWVASLESAEKQDQTAITGGAATPGGGSPAASLDGSLAGSLAGSPAGAAALPRSGSATPSLSGSATPSPSGSATPSLSGSATPSAASPTTASPEEDYVGTIVAGRYRIQSLIGAGGMGSVFKAEHIMLGSTVAIKILNSNLAGDDRSLKRFAQEARATNSLTHPNLASVSDYGLTEKGAPYLVMSFVEGRSLSHILLEEGAIDWRRATNLVSQICEAISHAHLHGVVHRDLKPANVIITHDDKGAERAVVVDFGIAKVIAEESQAGQRLTQTGEVFGSPLYMSPEQCTGAPLDARSDIYSLGCLIFEALTGALPFYGENPVQTILMQVNDAPPAFKTVARDREIPTGLEAITLHCLEKKPGDRYQSMEDVASDLDLVKRGKAPTQRSVRRFHFATKPLSLLQVAIAAITFSLLTVSGLVWWFGFAQKDFYPWLKHLDASEHYLRHNEADLALISAKHGLHLAAHHAAQGEIGKLTLLLGLSYLKLADKDPSKLADARNAFKDARAIATADNCNKHKFEACEGLGDTERASGNLSEAKSSYNQALTCLGKNLAQPDAVRVCLKAAQVSETLKDYRATEDYLRKVLDNSEALGESQRPAVAEAWQMLGDAFRSENQPSKAEQAYKQSDAIRRAFNPATKQKSE